MSYHLSSTDNSGAGLFNLTNSQLDAQSIGKSLVGVGRRLKDAASNQPIRQRKILGLSLTCNATKTDVQESCKYVD